MDLDELYQDFWRGPGYARVLRELTACVLCRGTALFTGGMRGEWTTRLRTVYATRSREGDSEGYSDDGDSSMSDPAIDWDSGRISGTGRWHIRFGRQIARVKAAEDPSGAGTGAGAGGGMLHIAPLLQERLRLPPEGPRRVDGWGFGFHDSCIHIFCGANGWTLQELDATALFQVLAMAVTTKPRLPPGTYSVKKGDDPDRPRREQEITLGWIQECLRPRRADDDDNDDDDDDDDSHSPGKDVLPAWQMRQMRQMRPPNHDPFSKIPLEVLLHILCHLPSADVRGLRLASRVCAVAPLTQAFWRSRFDPGKGLEYYIELREQFGSHHAGGFIDYRALYRLVKAHEADEGLPPQVSGRSSQYRNAYTQLLLRKRVWHGHMSHLSGLFRALKWTKIKGEPPEDPAARVSCATTQNSLAMAAVQRQVTLPAWDISRIWVSNPCGYVVGLRFECGTAGDIELGYVLHQYETPLATGVALMELYAVSDPQGITDICIRSKGGSRRKIVVDYSTRALAQESRDEMPEVGDMAKLTAGFKGYMMSQLSYSMFTQQE